MDEKQDSRTCFVSLANQEYWRPCGCWGSCPWEMHDFEAQMLCRWPQRPGSSACFPSLAWAWVGGEAAHLCSCNGRLPLVGSLVVCRSPPVAVQRGSVSSHEVLVMWPSIQTGGHRLYLEMASRLEECCLSPRLWISFKQYLCCLFIRWTEVKVAQSCPTLRDLMDYTLHGILQARIQEWVAFPFSRDWTQVSRIVGRFFTSWATRDAQFIRYV